MCILPLTQKAKLTKANRKVSSVIEDISLLQHVEERSGVLTDDAFLHEVLSDLIEQYPSLKKCRGDFDSWTWFADFSKMYPNVNIPVNTYGDAWNNDDGYIRIVAYTTDENGEAATEDVPLGSAKFNLTTMQNALQGAALWD